MTTKVTSVQDGPRLTVSQLVKQPTVIPARIIQMVEQQFITDALLRRLPPTQSGAYVYTESDPMFADGNSEIVEEFGEIPVVSGRIGQRRVSITVKRALAMMVSQEMINRNDMDRVNKMIKQIVNTMIRNWETAFLQALVGHPDIQTMPATAPWDNSTTAKVRKDLSEASLLIENAAPADDTDNYYGFEPTVVLIGKRTKADLIQNDDVNKVFRNSPLAALAPEYKGTMPGTFYGFQFLVSREMDRLYPDTAVVLEPKTVGGIGDERPMASTPLYEDKPRESWRSDTVRQSAVVIDQPKAALKITGLGT